MEHTISDSERREFGKEIDNFYANYNDWREANPEYVKAAEELSNSGEMQKLISEVKSEVDDDNFAGQLDKLSDTSTEAFLMGIYGMELSRKECQAALNIDIPPIAFNRKLEDEEGGVGMHQIYNTGETDIVFGTSELFSHFLAKFKEDQKRNSMGGKISKFFGRSKKEYPVDPGIAAELVSIGAHEFAHEVLYRSISDDKSKELMKEDNVNRQLSGLFGNLVDTRSITDSSIRELMGITWEKRTLKKHAPWAKDKIDELDKQILNAREVRKNKSRG